MRKNRVLILIPARFASTRFPGKPLADILGVSMIQRVWNNCSQAKCLGYEFDTYIVTDNQKVEEHVRSFTPNIIRVDDDVISGTLRIQLAYERFFTNQITDSKYDIIINVQGDEPLLDANDLVSLAQFHMKSSFDIATLVKKQLGFEKDFHDSNKVKVAFSEMTGAAFYFSRAEIPFKRDVNFDLENDYWFQHIGVYSYRPNSLTLFSNHTETRLENLEKLEQLRALEIGLTIGVYQIESIIVGVDRPEDIKKVEEVLNGRT